MACTGCASGHGELGAGPTASPNSERHAAATVLTGFHSAIARSQPGIPPIGTKTLLTMPIGNTSSPACPAISSRPHSTPTKKPIQTIANRRNSSSARPAAALPSPSCTRQPTARPTPTMAARTATLTSRSATAWPSSAAPREIGMVRNRSVIPRSRSRAAPIMLGITPFTAISTNRPGIR